MGKVIFIENQELLQYCLAFMAGVIITADLLIKRYLKNRRKKTTCALLKRRFEYFRY